MKISSLNKGLVAHYPLDIASLQGALGLADKTPNSNHGVSANTPVFTTDRKGQANRAMSFNGTSDYVDIDETSLGFTGDFSISARIKPTNSAANGMIALRRTDANAAWVLYIHAVEGLLIQNEIGGVATYRKIGSPLTGGAWYNVTAGRNSGVLFLYVNGVEYTLETIGTAVGSGAETNLFLGSRDGSTLFFDGDISDIRIYNRALSQQEITTLYESYRPKISAGSLQKGLVLDMPLTSKRYDAGNTLFKDLTPYENTGANTGGDVDVDHTTFVSANEDHVRIADSESLSPTSTMTAMVWVKGEAQEGIGVFTHWDVGTEQRGKYIGSDIGGDSSKMRILISDSGTFDAGHKKDYKSSIVAFDDIWHLIGFTFNAGTLKLYVDGVEDTSVTKTSNDAITTIHNSTVDVMIGSYLSSGTPVGLFNGDLSGAKIWNRSLSDQEILLLYEKGRN